MTDDVVHCFPPRDEWQMYALLKRAWGAPLVSLTDAVHWVATMGVRREPDYDELVAAAEALVEALRSDRLTAFGIAAGSDVHTPIPPDSIMSATASGSGFLDDLNLFVLPCIQWAHDPDEDRDLVLGTSGPLWSRLSVKREEMRRMWPAIAVGMQPARAKRGRGKPAGTGVRVLDAMRRDLEAGYDLAGAKESEMESKYSASRDTCRRMRTKALVGK